MKQTIKYIIIIIRCVLILNIYLQIKVDFNTQVINSLQII